MYCSNRRLCLSNQNKLPCSQTWFAMKKGMEVFNRGIKWTVGRNSKLSFWYDHWVNHGVMQHMMIGPLSREASNLKILDVIKDNGWDWNCLEFYVPRNIKLMIQATSIALASTGEDRLA